MLQTDHDIPRLRRVALRAIEEEELQAPSSIELQSIIAMGRLATECFAMGALIRPTQTQSEEFFTNFVVTCVNRAPGVGDVLSH
jgi:hypothetical protein